MTTFFMFVLFISLSGFIPISLRIIEKKSLSFSILGITILTQLPLVGFILL